MALDAMDGVSGSDLNDSLRFNQYAWPHESSTKRRMQQPSMLVKRFSIPDPAPQTTYEPGGEQPEETKPEEKKPKEKQPKVPAHTPHHPEEVTTHSPPHPAGTVVHGDAPAPHPDGHKSVETKAARFGKGKKIMAAAAASSLVAGGGVWMYNKFKGKKDKAQEGFDLQARDVLDWQVSAIEASTLAAS